MAVKVFQKVRHIEAPKLPPETPWVSLNFCITPPLKDSAFVEVCGCGRVSIYPFRPKDTFQANARRMHRSIDRHRKGCAVYREQSAQNEAWAARFNRADTDGKILG